MGKMRLRDTGICCKHLLSRRSIVLTHLYCYIATTWYYKGVCDECFQIFYQEKLRWGNWIDIGDWRFQCDEYSRQRRTIAKVLSGGENISTSSIKKKAHRLKEWKNDLRCHPMHSFYWFWQKSFWLFQPWRFRLDGKEVSSQGQGGTESTLELGTQSRTLSTVDYKHDLVQVDFVFEHLVRRG